MLLKLGRERNVRPDAADVKGNTAFIYACSTSSLECIDVFLRHHRRVAVNVQNKDGETGLIVACVMGNSQVANDLLHYPDLLDLSLADNAGNTAFHHVCKNNDLELARSFLKHLDQVPVNAANRAGKTPRDLATGERLRALIDREVMLYERSPSKLRVDSSRVSYDRTKVLGKGGFGAVYRGTFKEEVSPGRFRDVEVAVKESLQGFADAKIRALFDKEVRVWTALGRGHDNVLKLLSYSEDPLVMVCQYANAGNLQEYLLRIAGEQDYYRRALQLLLGVAKGMAFIHASHVVHGDLKALNVLVDARPGGGPVPLIADFGMSRVRMQVSITMGQADAVEGTLGFLAPELLQGALDDFPTPRKAKKADVFAFAMVAYMVSSRGKEPFHDARFRSDKERMGAILAGQRPRPPADAPKGLVELMARCWAADPEKRPEFAEVVRDLDAVIAAAP
ncbi:kinase-like domain-containing protein [Hyaloraphidium curvatum]|nr:kinase-like domain-containing protein [Hyaloraphidium curvatum]